MFEFYFCENKECRTILFDDRPTPNTNQPVENCPTCGRFGRKKDVPEEDLSALMTEQALDDFIDEEEKSDG